MSNTSNLDLERPDRGAAAWHTSLNSNMTKLDTGYGNNVSTIADLPQMYIETGTFNFTTGDTITLPVEVDATNEYSVEITPTSRAGAIGDIYVTKTTTNFVVKCAENNTTDTFEAVIYYIGDIASYGGSIYRRWYVSPDAGIADHGDTAETGSFAWVLDQIGATVATVELPGNKAYVISTTLVVAGNIHLIFQNEAVLTDDGSNADLTINGTFDAGLYQIFNWGNGTGSVLFGGGATEDVKPEWFDAVGDGANNDRDSIFYADAAAANATVPLRFTANRTYKMNTACNPTTSWVCDGMAKITSGLAIGNIWHTVTSATDIRFEGLHFDGTGSQNQFLKILTSTGVTIERCKFEDVTLNGTMLADDWTILLDGSENVTIKNCWFEDIETTPIFIYSATQSKNIIVTENYFYDTADGPDGNYAPCVYVNNDNLGVEHLIISNNHVKTGFGLCQVLGSYITITGNTIEDCENGIVIDDEDTPTTSVDVVISNNSIYNIDAESIRVNPTDRLTITGNTIDTHQMISVRGCTNATISGNSIYNSSSYGIQIREHDTSVLFSAVCVNGNTIKTYAGTGILISGQGDDVVITGNNLIDGNGTPQGILIDTSATLGDITRVVINNNNIYDGYDGIRARSLIDGVISGNLITLMSHIGIYLQSTDGISSDNINVIGNIVEAGTDRALYVESAITNLNVYGNILSSSHATETTRILGASTGHYLNNIHKDNKLLVLSDGTTLMETSMAPRQQVVAGSPVDVADDTTMVLVDYTATGAATVNLADPWKGRRVLIKDSGMNANSNNITIGRGSKNIEGAAANQTISADGGFMELEYDGTEWWIINS